MQIINYAQGLSARRFSLEELQPMIAIPYDIMTTAVQERYSFVNVGASADAQQQGLLTPVFEHGRYTIGAQAHAIILLEILPEGLRVMSSKTEISDAFIADLLHFAETEFGFRARAIRKPPLYASTFLLTLNEDERRIFASLDRGAQILRDEFELLNKKREVQPFGFRWISDDGTGPGSLCVLEKRLGKETGDDVYFSQASLPTASHERYLRRLLEAEDKA